MGFDIGAKATLEGDVDLTAEGIAERVLELDEVDEAKGGVGGEVEQEVDVALGLGRAARSGADEGNRADALGREFGREVCEDSLQLCHEGGSIRRGHEPLLDLPQ